MSSQGILILVILLAAPAIAYLVYRVAKGLGFLDPPASREQELRRTILVALYALLLLLPVSLFGYALRWPRIWRFFGIFSGLALLFFGASAAIAAGRLWKMRHPPSAPVHERPAPDRG